MHKKIVNPIKDQSGVALVLALIMIVILTLIGLASTYTSTFEMKLSGNKRGTTDAFYAADSGVQVVVANVENFSLPGKYVDEKYDPFTDPNNPNPTKAKVTITHDIKSSGITERITNECHPLWVRTFLDRIKRERSVGLKPCEIQLHRRRKDCENGATLQGGC